MGVDEDITLVPWFEASGNLYRVSDWKDQGRAPDGNTYSNGVGYYKAVAGACVSSSGSTTNPENFTNNGKVYIAGVQQ